MRVVFFLTVTGGIGLLTLDVWPGLIDAVVFGFPVFCIALPVLAIWFLLLVGLAFGDLVIRQEPSARRRWWGVRSAGIMFGTLGLLWFHVPQRIALACCYADLRGLVDNAHAADFGREEFGRQVGPYRVDLYAADRRGGVFFRTATGRDGLGPNEMSYGFGFRPNGQGTPFGNAGYWQYHLFGDWYVFAASDDW